VVGKDNKRLFVNLKQGKDSFHRMYFAYEPGENRQDSPFQQTGTANILGGDIGFIKYGRYGPRNLEPVVIGGEQESLSFDFTEQGISVSYALNDLKGENIKPQEDLTTPEHRHSTNLYLVYNNSGQLETLSSKGRLGKRGFIGHILLGDANLSPMFNKIEELKSFAAKVAPLTNDAKTWGTIKYGDGRFQLTLHDEEERPEYVVDLPEHVDTQLIADETRASILHKDPLAPTEVDDYWRFANFAELTGVKVRPAD
jgi:hypothetical protein